MPRRDLILLFAFALLFNFTLASFIREPGFLDDAYYFGGALRLAQGHGFTEPYLWNFLGDPQPLPQPSHLYWMPLTSIVAAVSMVVFGQTFAAARLPLTIVASALPLIAYIIAWRTTGVRRHALCACLLAIFSGYYSIYWGTTDSFAVYGVIGSLTLLAVGRELEIANWKTEFAIGLGAGLAHLARADGVLLLITGVGIFGFLGLGFRLVIRRLLLITFGYLLIMLPWFIRNVLAVGSPLGNGGAGTLWLVEYNDLFNYPANLTPQRYFAAGWQIILTGKWNALVTNLQTLIAVQGWIFLAPLIAIGLWQLKRHALFRPVIIYAILLLAAMTFAFSFPGERGGFLHSGAALMPFYAAACFIGLDTAVDWAAMRRSHWQPEKAKRNFSGLIVGVATILTLVIVIPRVMTWGGGAELFRKIGAVIPGDAVVMSNNPPGFWIATGHPGIPLVNGDVSDLLGAADYYSAQYVLLDQNVPPGLADLYATESGERLNLIRRWGDWKLFEVAP